MQVTVIVNLFFWSTENYIIIIRYIGTVKYYKGLGGPLRTYYAFWITPRAILRREIASVISGWTTWMLKELTQIFHEFTQGCIAMQPKFWEVFLSSDGTVRFFWCFFGRIVIYFARDGTVAMPQNAIEIRVQSAVSPLARVIKGTLWLHTGQKS